MSHVVNARADSNSTNATVKKHASCVAASQVNRATLCDTDNVL